MYKPSTAFISFAFLVLTSTPTYALAVDPTATPTLTAKQELILRTQENRLDAKNKNQELRRQMSKLTGTPKAEIKTEIKENLDEVKKENKQLRQGFLTQAQIRVVTKIYENARKALTKRYEYLVETRQKIETKLAERQQKGSDVTAATAKLATISTVEKTYQTHLTALEAKFQEVLKSQKPLSLINELRKAEKLVKDDLQQIRKIQVDALKLVVNKED